MQEVTDFKWKWVALLNCFLKNNSQRKVSKLLLETQAYKTIEMKQLKVKFLKKGLLHKIRALLRNLNETTECY